MVYFNTRGVSLMKVSASGLISGKINKHFYIITCDM